ncbi:hypothetical protein [Roseobacter litoralis]|uniref:hypothetical protein n=1 Tax=Roseobacter litoralis TaxID=42443 RepID=UPI00249531BC|nr:hypothetical protein [Roseobacter litoralis]
MEHELTEEQRIATSEHCQQGVDLVIAQSRANGTDVVAALKAMVFSCEETIHWAQEAIQQIEKENK